MTEPISWNPVAQFLRRRVLPVAPIAGTEAWRQLDDHDPRKLAALITAGSRWCLETELSQRDHRDWALNEATKELAAQHDWAQIAQRVRERDAWYRAQHPDLRRKVA